MSAPCKINPYHLLKLRTTATEKEIFARGRELAGEAFDSKRKAFIRQSTQEITGTRLDRAMAQFFEPAESRYSSPEIKTEVTSGADDDTLAERAARFALTDCRSANLVGIAVPPAAEGCAESTLDGLKIALLNQNLEQDASS